MFGYVTNPTAPSGLRLAEDLPEPEPTVGELVVDVRAFSVNRGELSLLQQRTDGWRPGQDIAGVVTHADLDAVGPAAGTRVVGILDGAGWSQRVGVPLDRVAVLPDSVSFEQAAALPIAGLTALRALRVGGPLLGRRVLVTGATGGVGHLAVQLARAAGAHVTAQVSRQEREPEAYEIGAHRVTVSLDHEGLGPFDLVLDGVGGPVLRDAVHRLAPGATAATYGTVGGRAELGLFDFASAPLATVLGFFHHIPEHERGVDLAGLVGFVATGHLAPRLGMVSDWEQLTVALDALRDRRVRGKTVLTRN